MLTSYHAHTAALVDRYCDVILVGDSLGNVMHGFETTVPVTLEMMILQGHAVMRGSQHALVVVDMPFGSYEASKEQAFHSAVRILKETHCGAVKLEGGVRMAETIAFLSRARHSRDGPYRTDAAVDQHARLVSRPGPRGGRVGSRSRTTPRRSRKPARFRSWSRPSPSRWRGRSPKPSPFPPSASAPVPPATARCWCWRICWGCRRGRRNSSAATAISARDRSRDRRLCHRRALPRVSRARNMSTA